MQVRFVHDWLVTYRGGEKVLESLLTLYPDAPIYTLFYQPDKLPLALTQHKIRALPLLGKFPKLRFPLLPLLPTLMESIELGPTDLVISTSSCVAKGIIPPPGAKHLCYIHSPMRYIWDQRHHYLSGWRHLPFVNYLYEFFAQRLRQWDVASAVRVDKFIANSSFVAARVKRYYGRDAEVIPPPVDVQKFMSPIEVRKEDFFLCVGAFVPYKRLDLAISACEQLGVRLVVAGDGPGQAQLKALAGKNTEIVIAPSDEALIRLYRSAKALIFPTIEDFGIVGVEALAAGTPILAIGQGGARDYVHPGVTGEFFAEQTVESLVHAIKNFDPSKFQRQKLQQVAQEFSSERFSARMQVAIQQLMDPST